MDLTVIAGFAGTAISGAAYVPEITHLVRMKCSGGMSRLAFVAWLFSSALLLTRAIAIGASVFIALGIMQLTASAVIAWLTNRYKNNLCPQHTQPRKVLTDA